MLGIFIITIVFDDLRQKMVAAWKGFDHVKQPQSRRVKEISTSVRSTFIFRRKTD